MIIGTASSRHALVPHVETNWERVMRDPTQYRKYAEECRRLTRAMPEHRQALLEMAQAWDAIAKEAERGRNGSTTAHSEF